MALRTCSRPRRVSISDHSFPSSHRFFAVVVVVVCRVYPPTNACSSNGVSLSCIFVVYLGPIG